MTGMNPAVVVALDCITGLQTARILTARGIRVTGIAADRRHFCARTRAVARVVESPTAGERLIETLERLGPELDGPAFLVPCSDTAVLTISAERDRLAPWYRFVLPADDLVRRLVDKIGFAELAQASDLPIPPTRVLRDRADAEAAASALTYPVVIKPGLKTAAWQAATKAKVFRVESAPELLETYDRCRAWTDALIAQSWVDGEDTDLFTANVYFDRSSQPLVTFITQKIRQWPVETGTGCLGVEVRNDAVRDETIRTFERVAYQGLGYLELKRDARTGRYLIIEPNIGRPTGRSATAERSGVEFLLTAYRDSLGQPLPEARTQRYRGVKWIYLRRDVQASLVAARGGKLSLRAWLHSMRGPMVEAVGSFRDPVPFLADMRRTMGTAARHIRRGPTARGAGADAAQVKV